MVRAAGDLALDWFRRPIPVDVKPADIWDPVTDADRNVEAALRAALEERFPDTRIVGEEAGVSGSGDDTWIIDPVDGTRAFVAGSPLWGTLLGFIEEGRATAGWMHLPAMGETYAGGIDVEPVLTERDGSRRPLATAATPSLGEAVIGCTHPGMFTDPAERAAFEAVLAEAKSSRYGGDCANYGLVALGYLDAVIETSLADYDIVAHIPIVEAAGGVVTAPDGSQPLDGGFVVASANERLHEQILKIVTTHLEHR